MIMNTYIWAILYMVEKVQAQKMQDFILVLNQIKCKYMHHWYSETSVLITDG